MWKAYQVVFKLKSPLHIGCGSVGNVQRTRPYITGRSFWGALTMRLTRDLCEQQNRPATDSKDYYDTENTQGQGIGNKVNYKNKEKYKTFFSWENENLFRRRFLSSYVSTALVYPQQAADEGLLHEVEFISPRTLDDGKQVYLIGYVFEKTGCELKWKSACRQLQIGGERGYGWGDLQYVKEEEIASTQPLFDSAYSWQEQNESIVIQISENMQLLAHTETTENLSVQGEIEPLVGREWRSRNPTNSYAGQHVEKFCDPCWVPGSKVGQSSAFSIQKFGIWQVAES
jgi:hypothetical protein